LGQCLLMFTLGYLELRPPSLPHCWGRYSLMQKSGSKVDSKHYLQQRARAVVYLMQLFYKEHVIGNIFY
jgi:hypothetical protein